MKRKDRKDECLVHDGIADGHLLDIHDELVVLDGEKRSPKKEREERVKKGFVVVVKK